MEKIKSIFTTIGQGIISWASMGTITPSTLEMAKPGTEIAKGAAVNAVGSSAAETLGGIAETLGAYARKYWFLLAGALVALIVINRN